MAPHVQLFFLRKRVSPPISINRNHRFITVTKLKKTNKQKTIRSFQNFHYKTSLSPTTSVSINRGVCSEISLSKAMTQVKGYLSSQSGQIKILSSFSSSRLAGYMWARCPSVEAAARVVVQVASRMCLVSTFCMNKTLLAQIYY